MPRRRTTMMALRGLGLGLSLGLGLGLGLTRGVAAVSIAEINGDCFLSPLRNQKVKGVTGLVTAVAAKGVFLRSRQPDADASTSEGLFVADKGLPDRVHVGDVISLDGRVNEYRPAKQKKNLYMTQLEEVSNLTILASGERVEPLVVGVDTPAPPTKEYSSLDGGNVFGVPNAVLSISEVNPRLEPKRYGLDFWESLSAELVSLTDVQAVSRPSDYGEIWVRGGWRVTGENDHGGMTMLTGDANPETILVGAPIDGSKNSPRLKMGDRLGNITGVVSYSHGYYRLLPLTGIEALDFASSHHPAAPHSGDGSCRAVSVASYNVENLNPTSRHLPLVADHLVHMMHNPDLIFLQEVQDDSGPANDGVTSANRTLATLADSVEALGGVAYQYVDVEPVNNRDGGQAGANIRCAYLYRPDRLRLYRPKPASNMDPVRVLSDGGRPVLSHNPGRIDPTNPAFENNRKPLVAMWKLVGPTGQFANDDGDGGDVSSTLFTINVHYVSKMGSTSLHGDTRPPNNKGVAKRTLQANVTADLVRQILALDGGARVITAGDFNEFSQVEPLQVFSAHSKLVNLDDALDVAPAERYTYLHEMNSQSLDHVYVSRALLDGALLHHLHLNTWQREEDQVSDHDPSLAVFDMCPQAATRMRRRMRR